MSNVAVAPINGVYTFDFTTAVNQAFNSGSVSIGSVAAMISGDADGDGDVDATDLSSWQSQNGGQFTYSTTKADFNLDGVINAIDRNLFQKANQSANRTSQVPTT